MKLRGSASPVASAKPRRALCASRSNDAPPKHELILVFKPAQVACQTALALGAMVAATRTGFVSSVYPSSCFE